MLGKRDYFMNRRGSCWHFWFGASHNRLVTYGDHTVVSNLFHEGIKPVWTVVNVANRRSETFETVFSITFATALLDLRLAFRNYRSPVYDDEVQSKAPFFIPRRYAQKRYKQDGEGKYRVNRKIKSSDLTKSTQYNSVTCRGTTGRKRITAIRIS